MRFVSTWLSYAGHVVVGTVSLCAAAVFLGYFPFSSTLGSGWDGWFVGEKILRLSMVASAGRALILPVLVCGLALGSVDVLLGRTGRRDRRDRVVLLVVAGGSTFAATHLAPGAAPVTPDVQVAALVSTVVFAARHGRPPRAEGPTRWGRRRA